MQFKSSTHGLKHVMLTASIAASLSLVLFGALSCASAAESAPDHATGVHEQARARYIIILREPALASFVGNSVLAKAPRHASGKRQDRLDVQSEDARRYIEHLAEHQQVMIETLGRQIGRPLRIYRTTRYALNSLVADLSPAEAATIASHADVQLVERDQDLAFTSVEPGPSFIGADKIWDGTATAGLATQGEGVVVGLIDSGVNWQSPSFAAIDPVNGYQHANPLGSGQYLGTCSPSNPSAPDVGHCNDKLIGMYNFTDPVADGMDTIGHGTHTASTAAGNHRVVDVGGSFAIAGVAPRSNIVAFNCASPSGGCLLSASVLSIDQAVADGLVDILSFSVAGGERPWLDAVSLAFLGAAEAGIFVAAAAGNSGPDEQTVAHLEPWVTTVGASTYDHAAAMPFRLHMPGGAPPETQNIGVHPGGYTNIGHEMNPLPIVRSPTFSNVSSDGCSAFPPGTFLHNGSPALAVMSLNMASFTCGSTQRRDNAVAAGAAAAMFVENSESFLYAGLEGVWTMQMRDWLAVWSAVQSAPDQATASISLPMAMYPQRGDRVVGFSSRGPNRPDLLNGQVIAKPDLTAPGLDVLAAVHTTPDAVGYMNGTSMATPHVSGAAALLRAVHPDWTPMEIKSALISTAWNTGMLDDSNRETTSFAYGAGRVDVAAAVRAGLVFDEAGQRMRDANPALGARYADLNVPSATLQNCRIDTCTITRHVRNTRPETVTWSARVSGMPGSLVVPSEFTLSPGATQQLVISIHPGTLRGGWSFGQVELTPSGSGIAFAHLPVAVSRDEAMRMFVLSTLSLATTTLPDTSVTQTMTLANGGSGNSVQWSVNTSESGCAPPMWASFSPMSGTILAGGAPRTLTTTFNAQGLSAGTYSGTLCLASNDVSLPLTRVSLELTVLAADMIFQHGFEN